MSEKDKKEYLWETSCLPHDNHKAISHHPAFEYGSYYEYQDSLSDYHFDKWRDDSDHPGINTRLKLRGKIVDAMSSEIRPFTREKSKNVYKNDYKFLANAYFYHQQEIRGFDNVGYKESVKPDKHPNMCKVIDWFEFEDEVQPIIMEKNVGNFEILHIDEYDGHKSGDGQKELLRVIIHLEDWESGQMLLWGNRPIIQWKAGDVLAWDTPIPHCSANSSRHRRYALRITGIPSKNTLTKLKQGGIINLDEL